MLYKKNTLLIYKIKMDIKKSKNNSSISTQSISFEDSLITLIPCEYDPEEGYGSLSEDSIDSSEILDSSDEELEIIKINEIYKTNEQTI